METTKVELSGRAPSIWQNNQSNWTPKSCNCNVVRAWTELALMTPDRDRPPLTDALQAIVVERDGSRPRSRSSAGARAGPNKRARFRDKRARFRGFQQWRAGHVPMPPQGFPPRQSPDFELRRSVIRRLPCGLPYAVQRLGHAHPALCPVRALLIRVPLGPRPWLHRLRSRSPGFVRRLRGYSAGVLTSLDRASAATAPHLPATDHTTQ